MAAFGLLILGTTSPGSDGLLDSASGCSDFTHKVNFPAGEQRTCLGQQVLV
jgi:hypothetical protein